MTLMITNSKYLASTVTTELIEYVYFILIVPVNFLAYLINDDLIWIIEFMYFCQGTVLCGISIVWIATTFICLHYQVTTLIFCVIATHIFKLARSLYKS